MMCCGSPMSLWPRWVLRQGPPLRQPVHFWPATQHNTACSKLHFFCHPHLHSCIIALQPGCLAPALQIASTLMGAEAASSVDSDVMRRLKADVAMQLNTLRNAAYAGGFAAAKGAIAAAISGQYA